MGLLLELVGNRRPTLAANITTTTAHHGLAPRTTQAGATSGALDTHGSTLGDGRHVACGVHDGHHDPQSTIRIPPRGHPHAFPADLEAPVHASQSPTRVGYPWACTRRHTLSHGVVPRSQESHTYRIYIYISIGTIRPSSTIKDKCIGKWRCYHIARMRTHFI